VIKIQQLSKTYETAGERFPALSNVDIHIKPGEIFGVIGKSGAGKSTLIHCVNLLEKPSGGQIIFDDADLTQLSEKELRQKRQQISMIFQHFNLLESRTALQNVSLPLELISKPKNEIKEIATALLNRVGLEDKLNQYPTELSGGQKQRVAIARALATNPKVLLCDEATSSLDPEATVSILNLLKEINREFNLTILLITHEMDVIKTICDRVAVLDKGKLIEQGKVIDIFSAPKSELTKNLTQTSLHLKLPKNIAEKLQKDYKHGLIPIVRLTFVGETTKEPVIANLSKKYNVTANILLSDLEQIGGSAFGFTICELIGKEEDISSTYQYLQTLNIKIEVLGYV